MEKHNIAKINEIFESIQGEGKYLGANQIFVRFSNCNLHCKFCDTKFFEGKNYDIEALMREILNFDLSVCSTKRANWSCSSLGTSMTLSL